MVQKRKSSLISKIKNCFKNQPVINQEIICAPFQKDIFYIFENFGDNIESPYKGFTNTIRSLLVNNILNHIKLYFTVQSETFNFSFSKMIVQAGITDNKMDEEIYNL